MERTHYNAKSVGKPEKNENEVVARGRIVDKYQGGDGLGNSNYHFVIDDDIDDCEQEETIEDFARCGGTLCSFYCEYALKFEKIRINIDNEPLYFIEKLRELVE